MLQRKKFYFINKVETSFDYEINNNLSQGKSGGVKEDLVTLKEIEKLTSEQKYTKRDE